MCGIFGVVRNSADVAPERATAVLRELGIYSMERGKDSSGLAFISRDAAPTRNATSVTNPAIFEKFSMSTDKMVAISKDTGTFDKFWNDETHIPLASESLIMIGHTRAATQGSTSNLANISPMPVGTFIGTHNGDIDMDSVNVKSSELRGSTDTEALYRALYDASIMKSSVNIHRGRARTVLADARGRIALAWIDRKNPHRLFLARAGLSPLSIAYDRNGNFYWASNPRWFRDIDKKFNGAIGFHSIMMVPEGHLISVDGGDGVPTIEDIREFEPTIRHSDLNLFFVVWRNFDEDDKKADKDRLAHKVAPKPEPKYVTSYSSTPGRYPNYANNHAVDPRDPWDDMPWDTLPGDMPVDAIYDEIDELYDSLDESENNSLNAALAAFESTEVNNPNYAARQALNFAISTNDYKHVIRDFGIMNENVARVFAAFICSEEHQYLEGATMIG